MSCRLFFLVGCLFISLNHEAQAQLHQPHRFEEEVKSSDERFLVISLKNEGLAFIRDLQKYDQGKNKWQLEVVDTALSRIWSTDLVLENRMILVGYEYTPQHIYLLFRQGESEAYNFQLLTIQFHDKSIRIDEIKFEVNFRITHFTMAGSSAVFGGYVNNEPGVLLYDQSRDHAKVLPGLFIRDVRILDVRANQNQSFNVLLTETKGKEKKQLIVRTFDPQGNLLMDDLIETDPRFTILSGLTTTLERDEMIIAGTYGEGGSKEATGFFTVVVDPFTEQTVTYTDFTSVDHFLDYLSPRKADKIKKRSQKERTAGRLPDYKGYVMPFRIEERSEGFYLLAELYTPSANMNPYPYYNSYSPYAYGGMPYGFGSYPSRSYYNGYNAPYGSSNSIRNSDVRMIQTMVIALNSDGRVKKAASLKLDQFRQPALEQVGDFFVRKDSIYLIYKKESDIIYLKEGRDAEQPPMQKQSKIRLQDETAVLKNEDEDQGGTRFWYDHYFYVWGYQTIKDPLKEGDQTRHVFYINKVSLE